MKAIIIICLMALLGSCKKDLDCYQFDIWQTTWSSPPDTTRFPHNLHHTSILCGLTDDDAAEQCKELNNVTTSQRDTLLLTITQVCTYKKL